MIQVMINLFKIDGCKCAFLIAAFAVSLFCGCATTNGFDDGRDDVEDFLSLKLSSRLPAPSLVELKGGLRQIEITWPAPEEDIYRFRIERSESSRGPFVFVANVNPQRRQFVDGSSPETRLAESTSYFYRLISIQSDRGPRSLPCKVICAETGPPPGRVAGLQVSASGSRANTLVWSVAEGAGVLSYHVERVLADGPAEFSSVGVTTDLSFVDGGNKASTLNDSAKYRYRVITVNEVGSESPPSESVNVTTLPPPKPVKGFMGTLNEVRCAPLKWQISPELDIAGYNIYCARSADAKPAKVHFVEGRDSVMFVHGGTNPGDLEDEGVYFFQIKAVNHVGAESVSSDLVKVVTRPVPPEIQGVSVESGHPREVYVKWTLSPDNSVIGYEIWRSLEGSDEWMQIKIIENNSVSLYRDHGEEEDLTKLGTLLDGTNYLYRVIAYNTGGVRSSASEPVTAKTKLVPVVPVGLHVTSGLAGVVKLSWKSNPESDLKVYQIESSSRETRSFRELCLAQPGEGMEMHAEESDLKVSVTRYYRIKAVACDGLESAWSPVVSGITKALPDAPSNLQQSGDQQTVILKWNSPAQQDIVRYIIWSKRFIGWKEIGSSEQCEYKFEGDELDKISSVALSAVDKDDLESEKSEALKLNIIKD